METLSQDFKDLFNKAKPNRGGNYVRPGDHDFEIVELKLNKSSKDGHQSFIADLKVLASDTHKVGETVSWIANFQHASAFGNVKDFLAAGSGESADDISDKAFQGAISTKQPLKGSKVRCKAINIETKKGGQFTKTIWNSL